MGREINLPKILPNGYVSKSERRGFLEPDLLARFVDFDAMQVLNLNEQGQLVTLSDKSLKDLLQIKVPDPKDDTFIAEGRPQRQITKTVNLADATLTLSDKMNAIATAMATGNTDTSDGIQSLRTAVQNIYASASGEYKKVMQDLPKGALEIFKEALKQIQLPEQAVDNGFTQTYYTINEVKAKPELFGPYLDQNINPDNTSIVKLTNTGATEITFNDLLALNNNDWILHIQKRQVVPRKEVSIAPTPMAGLFEQVPVGAPGASTVPFSTEPALSPAGPSGTQYPPAPPAPGITFAEKIKEKQDKLDDLQKKLNTATTNQDFVEMLDLEDKISKVKSEISAIKAKRDKQKQESAKSASKNVAEEVAKKAREKEKKREEERLQKLKSDYVNSKNLALSRYFEIIHYVLTRDEQLVPEKFASFYENVNKKIQEMKDSDKISDDLFKRINNVLKAMIQAFNKQNKSQVSTIYNNFRPTLEQEGLGKKKKSQRKLDEMMDLFL